jgi:N-acetylmuramoyl-L-alanine amidase
MKHLIAIILTLILIVYLLIHGTSRAFQVSTTVNVPYKFLNASERKEIDCLADNIYYEAGYEPKEGMVAVATVTLNRVKTNLFADTVCGVVKQKTQGTCQFTWLCDGSHKRNPNPDMYEQARQIALYVYFNHTVIEDITKGAIYYHADYVSPGWNHLKKTIKIGRHIFYTDPKVRNDYATKTQYKT